MTYHQGDEWIVLTRKVGDTDKPGLIIGYHKRRYQAVQEADYWREAKERADWCVWVERRSSI